MGSPRVRGVLGLGWAPRFYDEDDDGVADDDDECQELAEDRDGFEDSDGCPDFDNDDDGVPDDQDRCPAEKEDEDDFQDDDGCIDPDNDGDGIADTQDACPDEAGPASGSAEGAGCPNRDSDRDGVQDAADKCPNEPEDKDGFADDDGCPDPDNDHDRVSDEEDACPNKPGPARSDPKLNGCPSPDSDGDTFDDAADKCPNKPEDFDGVDDGDGCPDDDSDKPAYARAKPLLTIAGKDNQVTWRVPPKLSAEKGSVDVDEKTLPSVRALAQELNAHPGWVALVGVRPKGATPEAEQDALNKAFAIVLRVRSYTHRDEAAESVGWSAVKGQPDAQRLGIGVMVLAPEPQRGGRLRIPKKLGGPPKPKPSGKP